jgi:hypothetical protein
MKTAAKTTGESRPKRTTPRRAAAAATPMRWPTEDEIRVRAYAVFERTGGTQGRAFDDWCQAERELLAEFGHRAEPRTL